MIAKGDYLCFPEVLESDFSLVRVEKLTIFYQKNREFTSTSETNFANKIYVDRTTGGNLESIVHCIIIEGVFPLIGRNKLHWSWELAAG